MLIEGVLISEPVLNGDVFRHKILGMGSTLPVWQGRRNRGGGGTGAVPPPIICTNIPPPKKIKK